MDIPQRIISVVPSQTELLFDLGLDERVVGITKFCIHPYEWFKNKKRVGGTKNLNLDLIEELRPDLIIANKEENDKTQIEYLQERFPVWVSDIHTFQEAIQMIEMIGKLTATHKLSLDMINQVNAKRTEVIPQVVKKKVLYLIWKAPYMAAGSDTFIHDMLQIAGFENVLTSTRYPELSLDEIKNLNPTHLFLSSEPYPFREKHIIELKEILPNAKVKLVDGELFSWYGSRMLKSFDYFSALHEELF